MTLTQIFNRLEDYKDILTNILSFVRKRRTLHPLLSCSKRIRKFIFSNLEYLDTSVPYQQLIKFTRLKVLTVNIPFLRGSNYTLSPENVRSLVGRFRFLSVNNVVNKDMEPFIEVFSQISELDNIGIFSREDNFEVRNRNHLVCRELSPYGIGSDLFYSMVKKDNIEKITWYINRSDNGHIDVNIDFFLNFKNLKEVIITCVNDDCINSLYSASRFFLIISKIISYKRPIVWDLQFTRYFPYILSDIVTTIITVINYSSHGNTIKLYCASDTKDYLAKLLNKESEIFLRINDSSTERCPDKLNIILIEY
jgi:hypothetical protein